MTEELTQLSKKDFESNQEVRWCPGCGDYAILATIQKLLPKLGLPKEKHVFISGIGCSSRFPYYMNTYGFHTIHGRAPAIATGAKISNPELTVWVITGDGDALSIGGNHFMHVCRRNVDVNILLFNNRIYGLTKGQCSPTSETGKITKSTPYGSIDTPVNPVSLALAAQASFVGRGLAADPKGLEDVIYAASQHRGTSIVEIFQNCNVFNDGAFDDFADRKVRKERQVVLRHGEPLVFGANDDKGIVLDGLTPKVVSLSQEVNTKDLLHYDETSPVMADILARFTFPEFPVPMGVFYRQERPVYNEGIHEQIELATKRKSKGDLNTLLASGDTWQVP